MEIRVACKRAMPDNYEQDKRIRLDVDGHFWEAFQEWDIAKVVNALKNGANPNIMASADRSTPLHVAVRVGNIPMVQVLLYYSASVNMINDSSQTPLHLALWRQLSPHSVQAHDAALVATIIEKNPNPHISDSFGWTPLHLAAMVGDISTVQWLMSQKVEVDPANFRKQTPLYVATRNARQAGLTEEQRSNYQRIQAELLSRSASETLQDDSGYVYEDYQTNNVTHIPTYQQEWSAIALFQGINTLLQRHQIPPRRLMLSN